MIVCNISIPWICFFVFKIGCCILYKKIVHFSFPLSLLAIPFLKKMFFFFFFVDCVLVLSSVHFVTVELSGLDCNL